MLIAEINLTVFTFVKLTYVVLNMVGAVKRKLIVVQDVIQNMEKIGKSINILMNIKLLYI